jgi:hypothetical protein
MAMFSAIKRVVRENIACWNGTAAAHGVVGVAHAVSKLTSAMDSLPNFKTQRHSQTLL